MAESLRRATVLAALAALPLSAYLLSLAHLAPGSDEWKSLLFSAPAFMALYSKLGQDRIFDNYLRGRIFSHITANPGDSGSSMRISLGIPQGTVFYHLKRLETEGCVKTQRQGRMKGYFPVNARLPERPPDEVTVSEKVVQDIISVSPGITLRQMAERLMLSTVAVHYHVTTLLGKKLIRREKIGMSYRYSTAPGAGESEDRPVRQMDTTAQTGTRME